MEIMFPRRCEGDALKVNSNGRPLVIIGANGAGKSRFTSELISCLCEKSFSLSALHGLYSNGNAAEPSAIGRLYARTHLPENTGMAMTDLDRLLGMLMHDELLNLLDYKLTKAGGKEAVLPPTRLDRVISLWQEIFPGNRILVESGCFLFARENETDSYSALKLSDGERAVIYYIAGVLYAPVGAAVFINSPEMFLHPTIMQPLWSRIEALRPDCTFIYTTHDLEFASSRTGATAVWVRHFDPSAMAWDYVLLDNNDAIGDDVYQTIIGARKPVLFIEGDGVHSIDAKLYPLVFKEFTVKSLGSCNKVIEATRTFNDLKGFHHMDSYGIVDRDRRDDHEVKYLRSKRVMVPDVAEIENILMLEEVVRSVAHSRGCDENKVFAKVSHAVISQFASELRKQALMHTRHRVKRTVEYRIDGRFTNINMLEQHIMGLNDEIQPRRMYEELCREFRSYADKRDYASVLRVYNQKSMIQGCNVALCGLRNKDEYIKTIIDILRQEVPEAGRIRRAIKACFGIL